jgi:hypothetical protein
MCSLRSFLIRQLLVSLMLTIWFGRVCAQEVDVDAVVQSLELRQFQVEPGEAAWFKGGSSDAPFTITRFGRRVFFLDQYDAALHRVWRSPPLSVALACADRMDNGSVRFAITGLRSGNTQIDLTGCPEMPRTWLRSPEGALVWFDAASAARIKLVDPGTHRLDAEGVDAWLRALWPMQGGSTAPRGLPPEPKAFEITVAAPAPEEALALALRKARAVARRSARSTHSERLILPLLGEVDWRSAALSVRDLGDIATALQQSSSCADWIDAVSVYRLAINRDPKRALLHLALGDLYSRLASPKPGGRECSSRAAETIRNLALRAAEEYRLSCSERAIKRIPARIARRIAGALRISRLSAAACQPRWALFRAIEQHDLAALEAALQNEQIDANLTGPDTLTALGAALEAGQGEAARRLIAFGVDVNRSGETPVSPIVRAMFNGDLETFEALIEAGARLEATRSSYAPLNTAARLDFSTPERRAAKMQFVWQLLAAKANP